MTDFLKKKNSCPFDSSGYSLELTKSKVTISVYKNKSNLTGFLSCKDLFWVENNVKD